ncbi:F-box protein CPR1-like isoform X2 [Silene latifolia]|uniref:F-box protein CPR1-like isoform X2 n=1 Tax=Silene latifolia TaxID=37657 RepID=UPI003D786B8D
MAAFLPRELITEILTKLPVKSLHRFKCVSKSWNSLITSSKFIKQHLHQTLISNTNIIISTNSIASAAISTVKLRFDIVNHPLNNISHCPPVTISGSVHGVFLLVDSSKKTICLFNPSNKTNRLVPPAPSQKPASDDFDIVEVFGFGYDSVTDDYKIVRLAQWENCERSGFYTETSVYSMRNDSWKSVYDETVEVGLYPLQETNAIVVEELLWFVMISWDSVQVLKCFDLRTSTFSLVDFPEYDCGNMTVSLRSLRGCLCLLVSYHKHRVDPDKYVGDPFFNRKFLYGDVWEMKDCKWVKLFRVRKNEIHKQCMFLRLVTYSKDEKSMLIEVDGAWFGWYDLVTKKFKRVSVHGLEAVDSPYVAYPYVETLVSVVNNKVVSKKEGTRPKKTIKKDDFLSLGFKLKL